MEYLTELKSGEKVGESLMNTLIHQRVEQARAGTNPTVICKMSSGWAVLGDSQFILGYALLLSDPVVPDLNSLSGQKRIDFLSDMAIIGDALMEAVKPWRINYEILGNKDPALHAHIFPRYETEPEAFRGKPVWVAYRADLFNSVKFDAVLHRGLIEKIAAAIRKRQK